MWLPSSKETNELAHKSSNRPVTHSSLQQDTQPKYQANWLILEKKPQTEEKKFLAVCTRVTYPTGWSLLEPKGFFAPTAKCWGSQCHFGELWREDPQDKWSLKRLGPYPRIPLLRSAGQKGRKALEGSPKLLTKSKLLLLATQQASKLRDKLPW